MGKKLNYPLNLTFFGLTKEEVPQSRIQLFKQINSILYNGNGGYDFQTIYNIPIWLRNFIINDINKIIEDKNSELDNKDNELISSNGVVKIPDFLKKQSSYK